MLENAYKLFGLRREYFSIWKKQAYFRSFEQSFLPMNDLFAQ